MSANEVAIDAVGLVCSLGSGTAAVCAALRSGTTNPTPTRFVYGNHVWASAHQVSHFAPGGGRPKLLQMAVSAIQECLEHAEAKSRKALALMLCVAEPERPGRLEGLDDALLNEIQSACGDAFDRKRAFVIARGRPGVLEALGQARTMILDGQVPGVVIVATDSLLTASTLAGYLDQDRLLLERNSNGFSPGEGAGAVLIRRARGAGSELICLGVGSGIEPATFWSELPLKADGLSAAIRGALREADVELEGVDFRIGDASGEHYFFKESALAVGRILRSRKPEFEMWLPAEGVGEIGAGIGAVMIGMAMMAAQKRYARGRRVLLHCSGDAAWRSAAVLEWREPAP